ncbi:MAG TPA: protein-methionine-sulfoxide reductase catalytic subunit MsrP, partial [Stellaceae bacterium]
MLTKRRRGWEMPEREATPEAAFRDRRRLIQVMGLSAIAATATAAVPGFGGSAGAALAAAAAAGDAPPSDPTAGLYPAKRNERYALDRPVTAEEYVTTYNNFYEFGSQKDIARAAQAL